MDPLVYFSEVEEEVPGVEGGNIEQDHLWFGLDAREGVGCQRVALSRDGVGFGDSYIEHHYGQYHEHNAWLRISNILDNIKASSGNFFTGVKASSDKHPCD